MDLEITILSEDRERQILYRLYTESKKEIIQMNLYTKQNQTHSHRKQTLWLPKRKSGGGINQEFGTSRYKRVCVCVCVFGTSRYKRVCVCVCIQACTLSCFSHVPLFATLWIVVHQASLSMGFSIQEYWSGLPCPPPGDLPKSGIEPTSLTSPALTGGFFSTCHLGSLYICVCVYIY